MKQRNVWCKLVAVVMGLGLVTANEVQAQDVYESIGDFSQPTYNYAPSYETYTAPAEAADDGPWTLFSNEKFDVGGWFQFGYHSEGNDLFNSRPDALNLHQAWFFLGKEAVSENGELGFGFRFDGVYGIDGPDTQGFGNNGAIFDTNASFTRGAQFGWAIPQLYGEVALGNLSVKIGHFFTLVGYEVVPAVDNSFTLTQSQRSTPSRLLTRVRLHLGP